MAIEIIVPRLGWTMEEGTFVEWLKKDGDQVEEGDLLFTLENEKATQEVESIDGGILRIPQDGPKEGDTVAVGAVLGHLVEPGETITRDANEKPAPLAKQSENGTENRPAPLPTATDPTEPLQIATSNSGKPLAISPRAAKAAAKLGVDWTKLPGSGRRGRIRERDVRAAAAAKGASTIAMAMPLFHAPNSSATKNLLPISRMRRTIADRMMHSVQTTAPVTLTTTVDVTNLVNLRGQFQNTRLSESGLVPSYSDLVVKILSAVLRDHPLLNACWTDDHIVLSEAIHIALAVDTEAGLLVPVIRDVPVLTLEQLVAKSRNLVVLAKSGKLSAEEMQGGTFTVTNLGAFGIDTFTPIINVPQCAILGMGRISCQPMVYENKIVPRDTLTLSLTFDHRIVDGAPAARFLKSLSSSVENPIRAMLKVAPPEK